MIAAAGDCGIACLYTVLLNKIEALQTMKCCTAKQCLSAVVNFSFVMLEPTFTAYGFFFSWRNKPGEKCQAI